MEEKKRKQAEEKLRAEAGGFGGLGLGLRAYGLEFWGLKLQDLGFRV